MTFDMMRFMLARTIAKNEGVADPNRVAILPSMLRLSMPLSLIWAKTLAQREVAAQPVARNTSSGQDSLKTQLEELIKEVVNLKAEMEKLKTTQKTEQKDIKSPAKR